MFRCQHGLEIKWSKILMCINGQSIKGEDMDLILISMIVAVVVILISFFAIAAFYYLKSMGVL